MGQSFCESEYTMRTASSEQVSYSLAVNIAHEYV